MSIIMTLRVEERLAAEDPETIRSIADRAKEQGLIAHRFYGSEGQIMVVDEWPDHESFQRFFESASAEIQPMMAPAAKSRRSSSGASSRRSTMSAGIRRTRRTPRQRG